MFVPFLFTDGEMIISWSKILFINFFNMFILSNGTSAGITIVASKSLLIKYLFPSSTAEFTPFSLFSFK